MISNKDPLLSIRIDIMNRQVPLVTGEVYHVYNRGAHKQKIFTRHADYARFQLLMYVSNTKSPVHLSNLSTKYQGPTLIDIYNDIVLDDKERNVDVLGYTLMPNHFHMILRQKVDNGITRFLKKVSTGYAMYFNKRYEHSGTLFQGRFKSSHVNSPEYLRWLFAYVYLNPFVDKNEDTEIRRKVTKEVISAYAYGSVSDVYGKVRPERRIVSLEVVADEYAEEHPECDSLLPIIKDRP